MSFVVDKFFKEVVEIEMCRIKDLIRLDSIVFSSMQRVAFRAYETLNCCKLWLRIEERCIEYLRIVKSY